MKPTLPTVASGLESHLAQIADEFLDRLNRGEEPHVSEYLRRHPELNPVLSQVLPALRILKTLSNPKVECDPTAIANLPLKGSLGDFRLVREVGRGGMGIVYEAEQISLERRVALKILPFAGGLDAKHLQRFKNEALAAAQLQHAHIVPIYAVGCERGFHYYAMQFIDGQTLASLIGELRSFRGIASPNEPSSAWTPTSGESVSHERPELLQRGEKTPEACSDPETATLAGRLTDPSHRPRDYYRFVARLGIQAASALEQAHQQGIVHRDIKPANLLIDGQGALWIADFGLARLQRDHGLTLSGDVLGTLRYMSPEQALARHTQVDHRTDIYSLGATLYELLTLHPVMEGDDRADLLRRIAQEEPIPPRRHNAAIPVELETIVQKCLGKDPADRYCSSQELLDDLSRFMEDRPILARPPSAMHRASKWVRRHKAFVTTLGCACILAFVTSIVSLILIYNQQLRTDAAYQAELEQRAKAETNFRLAIQALDEFCLRGVEKQLPRDPDEEREDRQNLEKALQFYEAFARCNNNEPGVRKEAAKAYLRVGLIQQKLGHYEEAERTFTKAISLLGALCGRCPDELLYRKELARGHFYLSRLRKTMGRFVDAMESSELALLLQKEMHQAQPGDLELMQDIGNTYLNHGNLERLFGWFDNSEVSLRNARKIYDQLADTMSTPEIIQGLASCQNSLGLGLRESNKLVEARAALSRAVDLYGQLTSAHPESADYLQQLAVSQINLANILKSVGEFQEAESLALTAIGHWVSLVEEFPMAPGYQQELADCYHNLGVFYQETHRPEKSEDALLASIGFYEKLSAEFPNSGKYARNLGGTLYRLALLIRDPNHLEAGHFLGPLQAGERAGGGSKFPAPDKKQLFGNGSARIGGKKKPAEALGVSVNEKVLLAHAHDHFYSTHKTPTREERRKAVAQYLENARDQFRAAVKLSDNDVCARNDLAWFLATCPEASFRDTEQAARLIHEVVSAAPQVGNFWNTLGVVEYRRGHWDMAAQALEKSAALRHGGDSYDWFFLAMAHHRLGHSERARQWFEKAVAWMEEHQRGVEELVRFRAEAADLLGMKAVGAPSESFKG